MDNRRPLLDSHPAAIFVFIAALMAPCAAAGTPGKAAPQGGQHEPLPVSRIEGVSLEEQSLLLEQQRLLVDSVLAMQKQLKQLEGELAKVKERLAVSHPQGNGAAAAVAAEESFMRQAGLHWHDEMFFAVLALLILALWLILHRYGKAKWHMETRPEREAAMKQPHHAAAQGTHAAGHSAMGNGRTAVVAPREVPIKGAAASQHLPQKSAGKAEEDSMLEEAGLYAANGRMDRAAEILLEIIGKNPSKVEAWTLLFSIYSALCKVADFEGAAREFLKHHKNSPAWGGIQVLGRTLDRDNPLYANEGGQISAAPFLPEKLTQHRPIGDILIEMGILTKREILKYLDDFDPARHGRFGGYLVACKAITIAQLDQALLQQQGGQAQARPGDLPSLQDIEKLLAGFDPKRHGSVGKYLASLNVITPDQIGQLLRQTSGQKPAAPPEAGDPPAFGKLAIS